MWAVQAQDASGVEDLVDVIDAVAAGSIEPVNERGAVFLDVALDGLGDGQTVVVRHGDGARRVNAR